MTTAEKLTYYAASLAIIGLIGLRLFHLLDPGWGMIGVLFCTLVITRMYTRYIARLTSHNEELEEELERLRRTITPE